jgi:putative ABC transport system permease protein
LLADLRYAIRALRKSPGFTAVAVMTLALGIGATTAIYSVVDTILLQPLPYPDSDRLVRIFENAPHPIAGRPPFERGVTHQEFLDWRGRAKTLADATAVIPMSQRMVRTPDGAAGLWGAMTSGNTFTLLGARALAGRTLEAADEARPDVVVLSFDTWRTHFHSDATVIGRALEFRTGALLAPIPPRVLTVVGVLPPDFAFPTGTLDFFTPIVLNPSRPSPGVTMIARVAEHASLAAAIEEINALGAAIRPPWPSTSLPPAGPRFGVQQLKAQTVRTVRPALRVLLAGVVVVLLIVCANVANLLLARATARQREVAIRFAVGASRARVAQQTLVECAVLAASGGLLGALLGATGVALVRQLAVLDAPGIFRLMFGTTLLPRGHEVNVDVGVFATAFGIAALTMVLFGVLPSLQVARTDHLHVMGSRGSGMGMRESRLRSALVVGQLVMATVLLVAAGLLAHSFIKLTNAEKGYDPANVLAFQLLFPDQYSTARKAETIETVLTRLRALQGVHAAGFSRHGVMIGEELFIGRFVPPGRTLAEMQNERARVRSISDGYLTAMGATFSAGRDLGPADDATAPPVVVMNRTAARRYFGAANPIGQIVDWHVDKTPVQVEVIGVVEDILQRPTDEPYQEVFVDYRQFMAMSQNWGDLAARQNEWAIGFLSFALRTSSDPAAAIPVVREVLTSIDRNIGIDAILPLSRLVTSALARQRFYAVVLGIFAAVAAALAAIGIYGVLAYAVVQRTQEIGVRIALGARRSQVLSLVLRKGLILTIAGVLLGVGAAAAASRALQGLLFGITPLDKTTFAVVSLVFVWIATFASYLPARRATKVDPVVALRTE